MFTIISTFVFLLLAIVWCSTDPVNLVFKFGLAVLAGWGGYLIYANQALG